MEKMTANLNDCIMENSNIIARDIKNKIDELKKELEQFEFIKIIDFSNKTDDNYQNCQVYCDFIAFDCKFSIILTGNSQFYISCLDFEIFVNESYLYSAMSEIFSLIAACKFFGKQAMEKILTIDNCEKFNLENDILFNEKIQKIAVDLYQRKKGLMSIKQKLHINFNQLDFDMEKIQREKFKILDSAKYKKLHQKFKNIVLKNKDFDTYENKNILFNKLNTIHKKFINKLIKKYFPAIKIDYTFNAAFEEIEDQLLLDLDLKLNFKS